jgi:2'-5' RNA ligase
MRLFLALDPSEPVRARVAEAIDHERASVDAKWARTDGLHLTLIFFGEQPPTHLPDLVAASTRVAAAHAPFRLTIEGAGTFGSPKLPRVLWLGVTGALDPLQALVADLEAALGIVSEHSEYRPHLTLARAQTPRGDPMLNELAKRLSRKSFGSWNAEHFTLYESAGGRYRPLATLCLG